MMLRRVFGSVLLVAVIGVVAGCGGDAGFEAVPELRGFPDSPATTGRATAPEPVEPETPADPELCAAFQRINQLEAEYEGEFERVMAPMIRAAQTRDRAALDAAIAGMSVELTALLDVLIPEMVGAYNRLIELSPEIAEDVRVVRDFSEGFANSMAAATTFDQLQRVMEDAGSGGATAAEATLRIDRVSRADCGIAIAN